MDPQQRKLLEVIYECFENGCQPLDRIEGKNIGCYVGNFTNDYNVLQAKDAEYANHYSGTGSATSILANRVAHAFNLNGPSVVLDTACSSSLYALHMACVALQGYEVDGAVVASANLIQTPEPFQVAVKAGILSPDGICHTYDESANGYGRGEGVGALYLKRLSHAIRDGDPIQSVIRATAVNSNGRTTGISLPSAKLQERVVRKAYERAGLPLDQTQYVEAHGTGTAVGDPIEVEGLRHAHCDTGTNKLYVGSVKTNLGHSEGCSGLSSIMKVTLALQHRSIPPTIGIRNMNPKLEPLLDRVEIVREQMTWPKASLLRAGVNSFGFGGANAHVILEPGSQHLPDVSLTNGRHAEAEQTKCIIPFSARSEKALQTSIEETLARIESAPEDLQDVIHTLGARRSRLSHNACVIGQLDQSGKLVGSTTSSVPGNGSTTRNADPVAFVLTGQGAQWPEMGKSLIESFDNFRATVAKLDRCLAEMQEGPSWTLQQIFAGDVDKDFIHDAAISQPACSALQIALVDLLSSWDLLPDMVVGHSSGEIAAAYAAGAITADEAMGIAYYRGLAAQEAPSSGAMAAAALEPEVAKEKICVNGCEDKVCIACYNSPQSVTLSGDASDIDRCISSLSEESIMARKLKTDGKAYHSHHMSLIADSYLKRIKRVLGKDRPPPTDRRVRVFSSLEGEEIEKSRLATPQYWVSNLTSPVLFDQAVGAMISENKPAFIELGPHSALKMPLQQIWTHAGREVADFDYFTALSRGKCSATSLLSLTGALHASGKDVNFDRVNNLHKPGLLSDLPGYAWQHAGPLWRESRASKELRERPRKRHYLLGSHVPGGSKQVICWRNRLRLKDISWLEDHKLGAAVVFPAAGYINIASEALRQSDTDNNGSSICIKNMKITKALMLNEQDEGIEIVTSIERLQLSHVSRSQKWYSFEVCSVTHDSCISHATGQIAFESSNVHPRFSEKLQGRSAQNCNVSDWYSQLSDAGLVFGPRFQAIKKLNFLVGGTDGNSRQALTQVSLDEGQVDDAQYNADAVHPVLVDSLLQTSIISNAAGHLGDVRARVPTSIDEIRIKCGRSPSAVPGGSVYASSSFIGFGSTINEAELYATDGYCAVSMKRVRLVDFNDGTRDQDEAIRRPVLRLQWKPDISCLQSRDDARLTSYLASVRAENNEGNGPGASLSAIIDLALHKNAATRILHILQEEKEKSFVDEACTPINGMQRYETLTSVQFTGSSFINVDHEQKQGDEETTNGDSQVDVEAAGPFDLVVITHVSLALL